MVFDIESAVAAAAIAGCITIAACLLVEKLGGALGGAISMMPHAAVIGSIGFSTQSLTVEQWSKAMLSMSVGMCGNALFQTCWYFVSNTTKFQDSNKRLAVCFSSSFTVYVLAALVATLSMQAVHDVNILWAIACSCFAVHSAIGLYLYNLPRDSPKAKNKVKLYVVLGRGAFTFVVFLFAMWIASSIPPLAGILVNAPFVTMTTLVSLWITQSEAVSVDAVHGMTLGMTSASAYALVATALIPELGIGVGALVSWLICIFLLTVPIAVHATHKTNRKANQKEKENPGLELATTTTAKATGDTGAASTQLSNPDCIDRGV